MRSALPPPKPFTVFRALVYALAIVVFALSYWCATAVDFSWQKLVEGGPHMLDFLQRMFPPDWSILRKVLQETLTTMQLAWISTVAATLISLPIGFIAAGSIFHSRLLRGVTIFILNADRSIDSLILALFFVSAVGLGPFPGTLALAIHSVGMLGKLFADAIDAVDRGPIEALESAGAGRLATVRWAIWPQVAPHFVSYFLFRFELNVRAAVVLGVVGAGGIGFQLMQSLRLFKYQEVCTMVLVILALVMAMDFFSSKVRKALV